MPATVRQRLERHARCARGVPSGAGDRPTPTHHGVQADEPTQRHRSRPRRTAAMTLPIRPGMTIPLPGHLHAQRDRLVELADLGYTDVWSAESDGPDAFTPLALAAAWEPRLRLGTAIVPAYTRAPACFAQSVASMADAAPGRFAIGIGSSSNVIVERWNGVPFT